MTPEEQSELKKELAALDGLLSRLMPEDDLARLALDPKRQAAAAQMVGTVTLAKDLITRMRKRIEGNGAVVTNGIGRQRQENRGKAGEFILKRLERSTEPITRNVLANAAVVAGKATGTPTVYGVIRRLVDDGRLRFDDTKNTVELVK